MPFTSISFFCFVTVLAVSYRASPIITRPYVLLLGNLFFLATYGLLTVIPFISILLLTIICSKGIVKTQEENFRNLWVWLCVSTNIITIFFFSLFYKGGSGSLAMGISGANLVAVGLSYYALQSIDYVLWQYKSEEKKANVLQLFSYLGFFAKFPAGPIERAESFFSQKTVDKSLSAGEVLIALKRILWGLFKKLVIANRLGYLTGPILADPSSYSFVEIIVGVYALAFQIYLDFSAYCDIAIGVASFFGFKLAENFSSPYRSRSIQDFWHRWHITLTSWLKHHIYIPLGGNRVNNKKWVVNIIIVFFISGVWHGLASTFLVWASMHSFYYLFGYITQKSRQKITCKIEKVLGERLVSWGQIFLTFHLVALAWIPFASSTVQHAWNVLLNLFKFNVSGDVISIFIPLNGIEKIVLCCGIITWLVISTTETLRHKLFEISEGGEVWAEIALVDILIILLVFSSGVPGMEFMYVGY